MISSFFKAIRKLSQRLHVLLGLLFILLEAYSQFFDNNSFELVKGVMKQTGYSSSISLGLLLGAIWISHLILRYLLGSFISEDS